MYSLLYTALFKLHLQPIQFKAAPWDDINILGFYFCNEVVYPPDHDYIFYQHFYESALNPNKLFVYLNSC